MPSARSRQSFNSVGQTAVDKAVPSATGSSAGFIETPAQCLVRALKGLAFGHSHLRNPFQKLFSGHCYGEKAWRFFYNQLL